MRTVFGLNIRFTFECFADCGMLLFSRPFINHNVKQVYISFILAAATIGSFTAQDIEIPDVKFKNSLLVEGFDKNNDGKI